MEDLVVQIKTPQWRFSVILAVVVLIGAYYGITLSLIHIFILPFCHCPE